MPPAERNDRYRVTRAEALIAAAFRGLGEALVNADDKPARKERETRPNVVASKDVEAAVQAILPGLLREIVEAEPEEDPLNTFNAGVVEEDDADQATRARMQSNPGGSVDPNMPGATGWQ